MQKKWNEGAWRFFIYAGVTGLAGGTLFAWLGVPVPWLLGPMTAVLIVSNVLRQPLRWSSQLRDVGIGVVGYSIGITLTLESLRQMMIQLPLMLLFTTLLLLMTMILAYVFSRCTEYDLPTLMIGSVPGGLSQMVTLAEEIRGVNINVVTMMQVTRLIMIVFCVPLLLYSPWLGGGSASSEGVTVASATAATTEGAWSDLFPQILVYAPLCVLGALLGQRLRVPTAFLLGPMLVTMILHLSMLEAPVLPDALLNASQFLIGTHVGLSFKKQASGNLAKTAALALGSGTLLIIGSLGLTWLFEHWLGTSTATAFLSMAPGGMDQMAVMAHEVGANLPMVSGYQMFRLFFIFFVVSPLLGLLLRRFTAITPKSRLHTKESA
ncbi:AbrB family transcriptional regulator [Paenibacillus massiliensis]|uniref:AbrB family transcriptional regulator n=1 Tax=Paenibacillus massiliensis TaxID=225917 RepID=UPI000471821F|nr:AbrB family transcriptional regulator [Paenibacillus massiliensis]